MLAQQRISWTDADDEAVTLPRYTRTPLPARPWLGGPGRHPSEEPGRVAPSAPEVPWGELAHTELFRLGVDLFNHGFYWEAHEAWRPLWSECPSGSALRAGLGGLIRMAAARLKLEMKCGSGARKLGREAIALLDEARAGRAPIPIDLGPLVATLRANRAWLDDPAATPPGAPRLVIARG
jgi:hypothetical protein